MFCAIGLDVEDTQLPQSDEAAMWFAHFFAEQQLPATFFLVSDKVSVLRQRSRTDVLEALSMNDIGFHSAHHSRHPTIFELTQSREHVNAMAALVDREISALEQMEKHFGKPIRMFGQTGDSFTPAMAEVLSERGIGYAYMPNMMGPNQYLFWWKHCLVFPRCQQLPHIDDCLQDDAVVDQRIADIDRAIAHAKANEAQVVYFFAAHPVRTICAGFPDEMVFGHGVNGNTDSLMPQLYDRQQIDHGRRNFRRVIEHLKAHPDLTLGSFEQVLDLARPPGRCVESNELTQWCQAYNRSKSYPVATPHLSAAEALCAMVHVLRHGSMNGSVPRCSPYGPLSIPRESKSLYQIDRDALLGSLSEFLNHVDQTGRLPSQIQVGSQHMGLGCFARAVLRFTQDDSACSTTIFAESPFLAHGPAAAGEAVKSLYSWPVHNMAINCDSVIEQTLLATWCLRPAELK